MTFQALLAARAHEQGRAQPTALMRHRALSDDPLCIVAWQLGAEPYTVGAIALGPKASGYELFVPGYPLDRHLLFASLLEFAKRFCPAFESFARGPTELIHDFGQQLRIPKQLPQVIVPNAEHVSLLGRLGRRLAYLPTEGPDAADPLLPRLGRHLMWLVEHAQLPGQQVIVSLTDLLAQHYATAMSPLEMRSLSAIDAWIDPPAGVHGFHAAEIAETRAIGPAPSPDAARAVHAMMKALNEERRGSKDPAIVAPLAKPLRALYDGMTQQTWSLVCKVIDRERLRPTAPSVARREREDRIAYARHLQWMNGPAAGRRKTRMTPRAAAMRLDELERARGLVIAEEAIDDPLRMAPHLLSGKALAGEVTHVEADRRECIGGRNNRRPSITVRTTEACPIPCGTDLWWTMVPKGREWRVTRVTPTPEGGSEVMLVLQTNRVPECGLPRPGTRVCFSQFSTTDGYKMYLPPTVPWTHQRAAEPPAPDDLESSSDSEGRVA